MNTRLVAPVAVGCCIAGAAAYTAAVDPSEGGAFLPCPFRTITGWWCPGCGLTRATHHLLRGDLPQALRYNVFVVIVLAGLAAAWFAWLFDAAGRPIPRVVRPSVRTQLLVAAVLIVFGVVRNIPGVPGLPA